MANASSHSTISVDELLAPVKRRDVHGRQRRHSSQPRRGVFRTIAQVFGELLITLGVLLMLFVAYELWWTNVEADNFQQQVIQDFSAGLQAPVTPQDDGTVDYGPPPVTEKPGAPSDVFGVAYIPRFGPNYARPLVEGTTPAQLDTYGLGRYPSTSMPGEVGNFALAGHRQTNGAVLDNIHALVPGDRIYIQTAQGYYTYVFRNTEIVLPDRSDVLLPVPTVAGAAPEESLLTLTSCNPRFGSQERIIAYSSFESWRPLDAGPPAEIAATVASTR